MKNRIFLAISLSTFLCCMLVFQNLFSDGLSTQLPTGTPAFANPQPNGSSAPLPQPSSSLLAPSVPAAPVANTLTPTNFVTPPPAQMQAAPAQPSPFPKVQQSAASFSVQRPAQEATPQQNQEPASNHIPVVNGKINPPIAGKSYTISQLYDVMKGKTESGYLKPSSDFLILTYRTGQPIPVNQDGTFNESENVLTDATRIASMSIKNMTGISLKGLEKTTFVVYDDPTHIERLSSAKINHLGPQNKLTYQRIMLFILIQLNNTLYKLYINDPWPGVQRPNVGYPANEIIKKHNLY